MKSAAGRPRLLPDATSSYSWITPSSSMTLRGMTNSSGNDDSDPVVIVVEAEPEHRQAALYGDRQAHRVVERQPARRRKKLLLGEEAFGEFLQSLPIGVGQPVEEGRRASVADHVASEIRGGGRWPSSRERMRGSFSPEFVRRRRRQPDAGKIRRMPRIVVPDRDLVEEDVTGRCRTPASGG